MGALMTSCEVKRQTLNVEREHNVSRETFSFGHFFINVLISPETGWRRGKP